METTKRSGSHNTRPRARKQGARSRNTRPRARRLDIRTDDRKAGLAIVPSSEPYLVFSDGPSLQIFSGRRQLRAFAKRILSAVGER